MKPLDTETLYHMDVDAMYRGLVEAARNGSKRCKNAAAKKLEELSEYQNFRLLFRQSPFPRDVILEDDILPIVSKSS